MFSPIAAEDPQSISSILLSLKRKSPVLAPKQTTDSETHNPTTSNMASSSMPRPVSDISLDDAVTTPSPISSTLVFDKKPASFVENLPGCSSSLSSSSLALASAATHAAQDDDDDGEQPLRKKRKLALIAALTAKGATKKFIIKPSDYVRSAFKANGFPHEAQQVLAASLESQGRFRKPTPAMLQGYTPQLLTLVRQNDLNGLRNLHARGHEVHCCNAYGESVLHGACRRGQTEIVKFMVRDLQVDVYLRDDYQRTVLHDACWTTRPNFELVDLLIRTAPELLLLADVRGFTPLEYVRSQDWGQWLRFLWERKALLRPNTNTTYATTASLTTKALVA